MDGCRRSGIDLVDQRVELTSGPVAVPSHVDAGARPRAVGASATSSFRMTVCRYLRHSSMNSARRFF
jgi:hypothetical protein